MKLTTVEVDILEFYKRHSSLIKEKLKKHTDAYSIYDYKLDIYNETFEFKKRVWVNNNIIRLKRTWTGSFEYETFRDRNKVKLTIYLDTKKKEEEDDGATD